MQRLILIALFFILSGCSLKNTNLYGSQALPQGNQSTLSAVGIYSNGNLGLQITAINGDPVDRLKTVSFLVPPGKYKISVHANKDLRVVRSGSGIGVTKEEADVTVDLTMEAGHTYIPNALIKDNTIMVFFDDKGLNYPVACLPLYKAINNSSNPGHKLYRTDTKCEI